MPRFQAASDHLVRPCRGSPCACVAIVLAMGGTGLAEEVSFITSTNQVVLAEGARQAPQHFCVEAFAGPAGAAGAEGANGANGAPGAPGAAGSAKGYARVDRPHRRCRSLDNVGFASTRRQLSLGRVYFIAAPPGADSNGVLIVGLARRELKRQLRRHTLPRTVCPTRTSTRWRHVAPNRRAHQHDLVRHPSAVRVRPPLRREGQGGIARRKDIRCRTTRSRIAR